MKSIQYRFMSMTVLVFFSFFLSCSGGGQSSAVQTPAFYVDAVGGNDANSGTAPGSPWKSLAKVSGSQFQAGSLIYLKRGSTWNEQLTIPSSGITIDAYGMGALPRIDGSKEITGWTDQGSGLYSATITLGVDEALGNLSETGTMMTFLAWNTDAATTFNAKPAGTYSYDYLSSTLYTKPSSTISGNVYLASVKLYGITATAKSDVIVKNLEVTRFSLHGVHFKDCVRCAVYNSIITKGGGATIASNVYAGNGIEFGNSSSNGIVDGVTVSDIFDSAISAQTYESGRNMSAISIRNSQAGSCGFAGIEISVLSNGTSTGSSINNVLISGSTITSSGHGWSGRRYGTEGHGIRVKADSGAGTISSIQMDTTTIDGSVGDGVKLAGEIGAVRLHRMNIKNNANGISLQEPTATSAKVQLTSSLVHHNGSYGIFYDSPTSAGFELFQNTLSDNTGINLAISSWNGSAKIQNNIFYGSTPMTHLYSAPTLTGATIDNNCYNEFTNMIGYAGTAYNSVTAFTASTSLESNGIGGTVGLTDPTNENFQLLNTSQCKTLGSPSVGVTVDYSGYPFSTPPSSGAYQYR